MEQESSQHKPARTAWVYILLLIAVLLGAAYFRLTGIDWGENQYLHPDERFMIWVGTDISPTITTETETGADKSWISFSEYFDTANSPLNPNNRGHGFYVYGTFPLFITRMAVEWIFGHSGFDEMTQVGRALSVLADLLTILVVFLIADRIYDKRVGLLAAAFSAAVVMQIQQAHFFTMDAFLLFFMTLALYFAVEISVDRRGWDTAAKFSLLRLIKHPLFWYSLAFGVAYGMAMASKINALPIALLLPAAFVLRWLRMPPGQRSNFAVPVLLCLAIGGFVSLLVFRILQPYAFEGPGFFDVKINPQWIANLKELRNLTSSAVDFPPAMQWARRPIWFSGQNLVMWGLGLPLGILAWVGFLGAGWRIFKGDWQKHALLWGWTLLYFTWQSLGNNPTMRYQLPVYPTLVIFAGWAIVALWDLGKRSEKRANIPKIAAVLIGAVVLITTYTYAFGFTRIYTRPITRIEASRWIYQNIPGPINLGIQTQDGLYKQPIPIPYNAVISPQLPFVTTFKAREAGTLAEVFLPHVKDQQIDPQQRTLTVDILASRDAETPLGTGKLTDDFTNSQDTRGDGYTLTLDRPVELQKDQEFVLRLQIANEVPLVIDASQASLRFKSDQGEISDHPIDLASGTMRPNAAYRAEFTPEQYGSITELFLPIQPDSADSWQPSSLTFSLSLPGEENVIEPIPLLSVPAREDDPRGPGLRFPVPLDAPLFPTETYDLNLLPPADTREILLSGAAIANEGEWDDGLPLRIDGYDGYGGIYTSDLNFNMYWDDNPEKLERFTRILDQADYIVLSSNRQWGSLPRLPERFPMTTTYYRNLLGCPPERTIDWCYRVAKPGMFQGDLGFELVQVFQSDPSIGDLRLNDQFAEEAFTVYDHPKVMVFKKTQAYDSQKVQNILGAIDFSKVVRVPPMQAPSRPANLMLPAERLTEQQNGGTWSEIFNVDALYNRFPALAVILWYLSLSILGLLIYPLLRLAFPGLADRAYPLARTAGLLIFSYIVWLAGSARIPFTRTTISVVFLGMLVLGLLLAYSQRRELGQEWRESKKYYLMVEGLMLAFFLLDLLIRLGNPDLWHPWKGGEKPMDFAYLNAILKSTSFPPFDPWLAGGYLNYYYYGFVLVGVLIKWLGIVPSIAYNLILPTMFSVIAMGAFSLGWNLFSHRPNQTDGEAKPSRIKPFWIGLSASLGMALLGNLGTVRMIYQGFQRLAAPGGMIEGSDLLTRLGWAIQGFFKAMAGTPLPYYLGDWYWIPSRAIPAQGDVEPITEFPFFTVLYADPHAHLYALPISLLALSFGLAFILGRSRWKNLWSGLLAFLIGGLAIGALRPTNTWDFYTYLALGCIAVGYSLWRYYTPSEKLLKRLPVLADLPQSQQKLLAVVGGVGLLVLLSYLLFQPYAHWYGLGYSKIDLWSGSRTPILSYLTHWGLFLFVIISWLIWETLDWMANTPVSALRKIAPYRTLIFTIAAVLLIITLALAIKLPGLDGLPLLKGVRAAWLVIPLAAWAGALLLRPAQPDPQRFVLFLIGTGLTLTLVVELVVLRGDIGRMNTVFKFYLQVWTLFSISAAAALGWLLLALPSWKPIWRAAWQVGFTLLVLGAALFTLMAARAKIEDRMMADAPRTLDGMEYMNYSTYNDTWGAMDLSQDYRMIRWLQENVIGSPVIVEANLRELYRWGSRMSIYTGLPGVVGWEWHQQQQRALTPASWVSERIAEVGEFYTTTDIQKARAFLQKYNVQYIILGQQERGKYPGPGLDKFEQADGTAWQEVYRDGENVIYQVIPTISEGS